MKEVGFRKVIVRVVVNLVKVEHFQVDGLKEEQVHDLIERVVSEEVGDEASDF